LDGEQGKMVLENQKHVFWEALLVTIVIFAIGIIAGVIFENWRVNKVDSFFKESEITLSDIKAMGEISASMNLECNKSIQQNHAFADRIFKEAEILSRYEGAETITENIRLEHKKYDILRAILWSNSIELKKRCKTDLHTVVYIYQYNNLDIDKKMKQGVFSKILSELKEKKGSEIILIPMAGDNNLSSVSLMMGIYNVSESELPIILIDEKTKITKVENVEDIIKLIK
jgi:hypothetical protein